MLAMGSSCSVSWKAVCSAGSFLSLAAALKLSRASGYCPAQDRLPTQDQQAGVGYQESMLMICMDCADSTQLRSSRELLQHTRLALGTPFPEESFAKFCSALWLTLDRLQQKSGLGGISECNIFITCRCVDHFCIHEMVSKSTCTINEIVPHLCEGL